MLVELTGAELKAAYDRANRIVDGLMAAGARHAIRHGDNREIMRHAMAAEAAFQKLFPSGVETDAPEDDPRAGDGGYDFWFPRQRLTVDVKSRTTDGGYLIIPERHFPLEADIYVLGVVTGPAVEFSGWAWDEDFLSKALRGRGPSGPYRYLKREDFHPMSALFGEIG